MSQPLYNDATLAEHDAAKDEGQPLQAKSDLIIRFIEDRSTRAMPMQEQGMLAQRAVAAPRSGVTVNTRSFLATLLAYTALTVTTASPDAPPVSEIASSPLAGNVTVQRILPPAELQLVRSFTTPPGIAREGEYLVVDQCQPHDCSNHHAVMVEKAGELWVGIYESGGNAVSTRWYGTREPTSLPPSIQHRLLRSHAS